MVTTAQQLRDSLDAIAAIEPGFAAALARAGYPEPVSYTHLTLPTICSV